ncbi:MDR family MFS transporter [Cohnella lupini]|uniref:Putative MFS family arabinose efflux permease n=1 Tax=Cohnella lupini TaxID=1294267 RepID=A0A3D9IAE0_9BACL|nr:MFS transporter [Cohnella lupini]RED58630.1 putative MFS family arabinose efflux permease [Cohnella lupini]
MRIRDWDRNLKIRLAGEASFNVILWAFFPFLSIYFAESFGKGWTGILLMLSQALSVLANLSGGYCADRFGRKKMMVVAAIGQAVGYGLFALASSPWLFQPIVGFAGFTIASLFSSFYYPASQAMVADVVPDRHRAGVFAVFYTAANIAVVIGPLIGSVLFLDDPFIVLAAASALCVLLAILLGRLIRETLPIEIADRVNADKGRPWYRFITEQLRDYRVIASDRVFFLFILAGVLLSQTFMQLDLLFPVFLKETVPLTTVLSYGDWSWQLTGEKLFGLIVSENGLFVALFTVIVTRWMLGFRDRIVFIGGALFYALGIAIFGQMSTFWGFTLAIAVFTLAELMSAGPQQAFVSRLAPEHMRGQYFAASSVRFTLGRTIAPLSIPLSSWIGFEWTFWILTGLSILAAFLYHLMFNRYDRQG